MYVKVANSLGDAIYCRPYIKAYATKIETKWPELFSDLTVDGASGQLIKIRYDSKNLALGNIPHAIGRFFPPLESYKLDLPKFKKPDIDNYVVIRAPTIRRKFNAPARNPIPEYISQANDTLQSLGYTTVGVGNIGENEWFDGEPPNVDIPHWNGVKITTLMGLIAHSKLVVAGTGYTVPASIAFNVPHILIYGGAAKWNKLDKLVDPKWDTLIETIEPDNFCTECKDVRHNCDKTITGFKDKFSHAIDKAMCLRKQQV